MITQYHKKDTIVQKSLLKHQASHIYVNKPSY
jgi:hypothetical protein